MSYHRKFYATTLRPFFLFLYHTFQLVFIGIVLALACGAVFGTFFGACNFVSDYTKQVLTK